jgi:hypothetical protein
MYHYMAAILHQFLTYNAVCLLVTAASPLPFLFSCPRPKLLGPTQRSHKSTFQWCKPTVQLSEVCVAVIARTAAVP